MEQTAELDLMQRVQRLCGPLLTAFAPRTSIPIAFWAALTANESGCWLINNTVIPPRFERSAFSNLMKVVRGEVKQWRQLTIANLAGLGETDIRHLARSWGLTQVMGYHAQRWRIPFEHLNDPGKHYNLAARLMAEFVTRFGLDPLEDFEEMARCWNTGRADDPPGPAGDTHDPDYIPNLLRRMEVWSEVNKRLATP